ncbi:hypothetical protein [Clostridium botulinum]|nr:hypothetical protein [Clostridium botulinum]
MIFFSIGATVLWGGLFGMHPVR